MAEGEIAPEALGKREAREIIDWDRRLDVGVSDFKGETIVSGDWVGANNLSKFIAAASRPQQKVLFVSEKWGIDGTERIYFAQADEAYAPTAVHDLAA